jgi:hypothetical protein
MFGSPTIFTSILDIQIPAGDQNPFVTSSFVNLAMPTRWGISCIQQRKDKRETMSKLCKKSPRAGVSRCKKSSRMLRCGRKKTASILQRRNIIAGLCCGTRYGCCGRRRQKTTRILQRRNVMTMRWRCVMCWERLTSLVSRKTTGWRRVGRDGRTIFALLLTLFREQATQILELMVWSDRHFIVLRLLRKPR